MTRIHLIGIAAIAAMLLGACSAPADQASPAPTVTVTVTQSASAPPSSTAAPVTPSTVSKRPTDGRMKLGGKFVGAEVEITVSKFDRKVASGIEDVPYMEAALVKTCVKNAAKPLELGWSPWEITNADGERYEQSDWSPLDKKPLYPNGERTYDNGECAKGWILFESYKKNGDTIRYENSEGEIARWEIP